MFSNDQLLTNALLYILTDSFATATWFYAGAQLEGVRRMPPGRRVTVPTAFAAYRIRARPRRRGTARARLRGLALADDAARRALRRHGGPDLFVQDLRDWGRG